MTKPHFDGLAKPSQVPSSRKANIHAGFDGFDGFDWVQIVQPKRQDYGCAGTAIYDPFSTNILSSQSRQSRQKPCAATLSALTACFEFDGLPVKKLFLARAPRWLAASHGRLPVKGYEVARFDVGRSAPPVTKRRQILKSFLSR